MEVPEGTSRTQSWGAAAITTSIAASIEADFVPCVYTGSWCVALHQDIIAGYKLELNLSLAKGFESNNN
jgi:hypothetical protein